MAYELPNRFDVLRTAPCWMTPREATVLYGLTFGIAPQDVLEIGTFKGGSTMVMCAALDDLDAGRIVCVDPDPRLEPETWEAIRHRAEIVAEPSPAALPAARARAGAAFELALIDGDHARPGVDHDIDGVLGVLAPGAHVLLHDAHHGPVRDAIDAALERHAGRLIDAGLLATGSVTDDDGNVWGGLRLLRFAG